MIDTSHPYYFLSRLFQKPGAVFYLSKYVYRPDSLFDERELIEISGYSLNVEWLEKTIADLGPEQELALHSEVRVNERLVHIPMIDLAYEKTLSIDVVDRLRLFLPKAVFLNMAVYESGRSFHIYSNTLLSPKQWIDFMGRLLLINPRDAEKIVDSRWVGHRLIGGFASLRWSSNTAQYLHIPSKIKFPI